MMFAMVTAGLTEQEARQRLATIGPNASAEADIPLFRCLLARFWGRYPGCRRRPLQL